MALCPFAENRTAGINNGGPRPGPVIGVTVHHMDGWWQGAESVFKDQTRGSSAAFGVKLDGAIIQWVDTAMVDNHACQAQWEGWLGIENESDPATPDAPPTAAQIVSMGKIIEWLGTPTVPATSRQSGGVAYHRQFPGPCNQAWGQTACPGQGFIDAIPAICAAAHGVPSPLPNIEDDDMSKGYLIKLDGWVDAVYWRCGATKTLVPDTDTLNRLRVDGFVLPPPPLSKIKPGTTDIAMVPQSYLDFFPTVHP